MAFQSCSTPSTRGLTHFRREVQECVSEQSYLETLMPINEYARHYTDSANRVFSRGIMFFLSISPATEQIEACMLFGRRTRRGQKRTDYSTSISLTAGVITASVAKSMGVPCTIVYGGSKLKKPSQRNKYARILECSEQVR